MSLRVDTCGIQMNNGVADSNGVKWTVSRLGDWIAPDLAQSLGQVTGRDGASLLEDGYGKHAIEQEGLAMAATLEAAWAAFNQLNRMPGVRAEGDLVVYEDVPKRIRVRQGDVPRAPLPRPMNGGWGFDYMLTLVALDPFKRALTPTTVAIAAGATVSVPNAGNAPAFLTITATGSGTVNVVQTVTGQALRSKASVASGTVFDSARARVETSGGVQLLGVINNPSEWLTVAAESSTPVHNLGTAPLLVTVYDTYS